MELIGENKTFFNAHSILFFFSLYSALSFFLICLLFHQIY